MRTVSACAIIGLLALVAPALAQIQPNSSTDCQQVVTPLPDDASSAQLWITGDYLLWWLRGDRLPPLVTTSPPGTPQTSAGVLGTPGSQVLFGDDRVNASSRSGGRLTAGYWLDPDQTWGIEARFFMLEALAQRFAAQSPGDPILARPFLNTASGQADSELVAFPGILGGSVSVAARSSNLLGAEALGRGNLLALCGDRGLFRLDALAGYRFLYLDETLAVQENLVATTTMQVPAGTTFAVRDQFGTHNVFHGGQLGFAAGLWSGPWSLNVLGKLGLGVTSESVYINGSTASTLPGGPTNVLPGGLLALSSNSGRHSDSAFSFVPELDVKLGYRITDSVRLTVGYTLLYWTNIVRPGDQIDLAVNPNLIPPVLQGGLPRPAFEAQRTSLWAQGVCVGLAFAF